MIKWLKMRAFGKIDGNMIKLYCNNKSSEMLSEVAELQNFPTLF